MKKLCIFVALLMSLSLVAADVADAKRGGGRRRSSSRSYTYTPVKAAVPKANPASQKKTPDRNKAIPNYDIEALCSSGGTELDYDVCVQQENRARTHLNKRSAPKIRRCIPSAMIGGYGSYAKLERCTR